MSLFYTFHFYLFGVIAIASSIVFVTRKSPVAAAMWLVTTMFCLAALYIMLGAEFVGAIQVLVYAGAIMVVFLFVVMLLNLGNPAEIADIRGKWAGLFAAFVGLALLAELMTLARARVPGEIMASPVVAAWEQTPDPNGVVGLIAAPLFRDYLLAFEITSVLLLAAIVGSVVIGRGRHDAR
jgi:NADH-quinone oxidoreductase subunit J